MHKPALQDPGRAGVYGKITGTIDTLEKFEAERLEARQSTNGARMKKAESRECRSTTARVA